jgi:hypothetical protein
MIMDELRDFIRTSPWTFARTMPEIPHEYTLRAKGDSPDRMQAHFRDSTADRYFGEPQLAELQFVVPKRKKATPPKRKVTRVFVSYSRHDESLVKPLAAILGVPGNDAVFMDVEQLKPGDLWSKEIIGAVRASSVFVICWCCQSKGSEYVTKEISAALTDKNKKLVPVLFCSTKLPSSLSKRQWIDLRGKVVHKCNHNDGSDDLISLESLETVVEGREPAASEDDHKPTGWFHEHPALSIKSEAETPYHKYNNSGHIPMSDRITFPVMSSRPSSSKRAVEIHNPDIDRIELSARSYFEGLGKK